METNPADTAARAGAIIEVAENSSVASYDFNFFFQAEDGIRDVAVTGVQTCALPICEPAGGRRQVDDAAATCRLDHRRSEEHTSELQSRLHLVCRLLLEKKKTLLPVL